MSGHPAAIPAVVGLGPEIAGDRLARHSRQLLLPGFGLDAQRRLANARVLIVGAGGLGSASGPTLAGAGVGTIGIIDSDAVELSNLHRQTSHGLSDVGRNKAESMADTIAAIDPEITVRVHPYRLSAENALGLFADYDLILDGSDNFATRYLVNDAAALCGLPLVWGAILRYGGQAGVAYARYGPTYRDLFPTPPAPEDVLSCADGGVLPSVCASIGAIMSAEAIKLITGVGEPLIGRVTSYDAVSGRFRELAYRASPDAAPITGLVDYELFCGRRPATDGLSEQQARPGPSNPEPNSAGSDSPSSISPSSISAGSISALALAALRASGSPVQLVDVREPFELAIAAIDGAEPIPLGTVADSLGRFREDIPVVLFCHHDTRSRRAAGILSAAGRPVRWLEGGIDAWARVVDPALARY